MVGGLLDVEHNGTNPKRVHIHLSSLFACQSGCAWERGEYLYQSIKTLLLQKSQSHFLWQHKQITDPFTPAINMKSIFEYLLDLENLKKHQKKSIVITVQVDQEDHIWSFHSHFESDLSCETVNYIFAAWPWSFFSLFLIKLAIN